MFIKTNPLNIRASKSFNWLGQTGSQRGFCTFKDERYCFRAGAYLLMRSYRRAGCFTLAKIIARWAPSFENPTSSYMKFVSDKTGYSYDFIPVTFENIAKILTAMEMFEQGYKDGKDGYLFDGRYFTVREYVESANLSFG